MSKFSFLAENPELVRLSVVGAVGAGSNPRGGGDKTTPLKSLTKEELACKRPEVPLTASYPTGTTLGVLPEKFVDDLEKCASS